MTEPWCLPPSDRSLPPPIRSKIVRLLILHWRPDAIAEDVHCGRSTVYEIQENLFLHGSPFKPQLRLKDGPRTLHKAFADSLVKYLEDQPWALQKEMVWFLWEGWGLFVHQSTISRILKRLRQSQKLDQRVKHR